MKSKLIVFFLFFTIAFQVSTLTFVSAQDSETTEIKAYWDKYTILANQLKVSLNNTLPSGVEYQIGSPRYIRFTPLNSMKISEKEILYRAEVVFEFDFTVSTTYSTSQLQIAQDNFVATWGRFFFCERFNLAYNYVFVGSSSTKNYNYDPGNKYCATSVRVQLKPVYMHEPSITVTSYKLNTQPNWGFYGDFDFNIKLEFDDSHRDFGDVQVKMKRKAFIARLEQSQVVKMEEYVHTQPPPSYNKEIQAKIIPQGAGDGKSAFESKINELNLGVTAGAESYRTVIEGESVPAPTGATLVGGVKLRGIKLYPNVLEKRQTVNIRFGSLDIDTQTEYFFGSPVDPAGIAHVYGAVTTDTRQRVLGYEIKNRGQHYTIRSSFTLEALNEIEVTQTEKPVPLDKINQTRDEFYWDNYIEGETEIITQETELDITPIVSDLLDFLSEYWLVILIIILVVAVLGITLYIRFSNPMSYVPPPSRYYQPR